MRFQVLTVVVMKTAVFWFLAPCSVAEVYCRFRGICCLVLQGGTTQDTHTHPNKYSAVLFSGQITALVSVVRFLLNYLPFLVKTD